MELLEGAPGPLLDLGCGEGRVLRGLAGSAVPLVGVDASAELAARASATAPVVRARLPALDWLAGDVLGGVYAVLMIEHIEDLAALFGAALPGGAARWGDGGRRQPPGVHRRRGRPDHRLRRR